MSELIISPTVSAPRTPEPREVTQEQVLHLLSFALTNHPERLTIFPVTSVLMEAARSNDKRPAWLKMATLDSVVKNITGNEKLTDYMLMLRIPREVGDRAFSPIVAPLDR